VLQPVSLFKVLIDRIGYRNPIIASYQPPRVGFDWLLIFYDDTSPRGQAPDAKGSFPNDHPFCIGKKTALCEGVDKEKDRQYPINDSKFAPHFLPTPKLIKPNISNLKCSLGKGVGHI
jgi:hypothetical protein